MKSYQLSASIDGFWRRPGRDVLAAVLLLAGCEATPIDSEAAVAPESEVAAQVAVERAGQRPALNALKGEFGPTVKLSGTLCSGETSVTGTGGVGSVMIDGALDTLSEGGTSRGSCTAELEITVPAGFQLAPSVCATVALTAEKEDSRAKVRLRASYPGVSSVGSLTKTIEGYDGESTQVCAQFPQVISSGCATSPRTHKLAIAVDLETAPGTLLQLKSLDADLTYADGAVFRSCSSRGQTPAASARDEGCGGPNKHACSAGLTCRRDRLTYGGTAGRCLSYADATRPRKAQELCGPGLTPACASDLLCVLGDYERGGEQVGLCTSKISNQGEECGALTGRTCRPDLLCSDLGRCEDPNDRRATPEEGEACADTAPGCVMGLTCDAESQTCRASTGAWGEGCKSTTAGSRPLVSCQSGLTCLSAICRSLEGRPGARCVVDNECRSKDCDVASSVCR